MKNRYRSILDAHPDAICRYDENLVISFANNSFGDLLGKPVKDITGQCFDSFLSPAIFSQFKTELGALSVNSPEISIPARQTTLGDRRAFIQWTILAMHDDDGKIIEYQSSGRDVSKEQQLYADLAQRNAELEAMQQDIRLVLDSMPCKVWYKDNKNTILKLNSVAAESMGMKIEDIEGQNTYDLFGDSAKAYHDDDLKVIETGEPLLGRVERYTPNDGPDGWVQTDKIPFVHPITGEKRILVVSTDITKLKDQEALLTTINKSLDDFASLTSHDLQQPLSHVAVFAELLQTEHGEYLDKEGQEYIRQILDGVGNMRGLIQSFLKFMRASPEGIDLGHVNLSDVIEEVIGRNMSRLTDIQTKLTLPARGIYVRGDKTLLEQVFVNLVENALKYRDLDLPFELDISASKIGPQWQISVADNGIGIDANSATNIFNLFDRAKPKSNQQGSGIGLAVCKRIIILHGGDIKLVPGRKKGSEFSLTLNAARAPE